MTDASDISRHAAGSRHLLTRRFVHELDSVTTGLGDVASSRAQSLTQLRQRENEIEREHRQQAARAIDQSILAELRSRLSASFPDALPDGGLEGPRPETWADARLEWDACLSRATSSIDQLIVRMGAWSARGWLMRSLTTRPTVPTEVWRDLQRLEELRRVIPVLLDAMIADGLRAERTSAQQNLDQLDEKLSQLRARALVLDQEYQELEGGLPRAASRWGAEAWAADGAPSLPAAVRLGHLSSALPGTFPALAPPLILDFPFSSGLAVKSTVGRRDHGVELLRALSLRLLAAVPAGDVRFVFVDPVSLGQSVAELRHLADFDDRLVDPKTWTSERDIERRLEELTGHLEVVISSYLRGQFETIDEYNRHAGAVAEPYVVLVVFDYPEGFTARSARHLLSLIENGPRCGLHTLLLHGTTAATLDEVPISRLVHSMQRVELGESVARVTLEEPVGTIEHEFVPDVPPPVTFSSEGRAETVPAQILLDVGRGARTSSAGPVTLERLLPIVDRLAVTGLAEHVPARLDGGPGIDPRDPATWWTSSTAERTAAIIGQAGARDVASMVFSSTEIAGGAIMVGLPRSGKSTALHAAIMSLALAYSPDELDLYLIDSKHGVEFKAYEALPHARMVAIRSEREFSVAVLRSLAEEIARRAELMKRETAGKGNITEYRRVTGEPMARIVLMMDEFHEVFEEDDPLGQEAFRAFSDIVRQGPFAGVHVVVSSQTLSSMPAMDRSTLSLLPMRIAFTCNDADADIVMGDANREVRALSEQGHGIFNPASGEPSRNKPFRGLYIDADERTRLLREVREKADAAGIGRHPRVFDGDTEAARPAQSPVSVGSRLSLALGEPFDLGVSAGVMLRRSRGANVVCVGAIDDEEARDDAVGAAVGSCILDAVRAGASVTVVDFVGGDAIGDGLAMDALCHGIGADYARGRQAERILVELAAQVAERQEAGTYDAPTRLLVLHGVHRALSLEPEERFAESDGQAMAIAVGVSLRDGPDVGVHVLASVDSLTQFERRMGREALAEFAWRVAGNTTTTKDLAALTEAYGKLEVRANQLLIVDHAKSRTRRVRGYSRVTDADLTALKEGSA